MLIWAGFVLEIAAVEIPAIWWVWKLYFVETVTIFTLLRNQIWKNWKWLKNVKISENDDLLFYSRDGKSTYFLKTDYLSNERNLLS